jgi:hypothetical protein
MHSLTRRLPIRPEAAKCARDSKTRVKRGDIAFLLSPWFRHAEGNQPALIDETTLVVADGAARGAPAGPIKGRMRICVLNDI